ncbi:MAG: putative toxin-antitoxin system toxin component, PIN family [Candidatus Rokuibacteriota bacterium]|nr:MAG: putative toxin-antitoxin system toxin component, PIN family [Candidatus Rokubacteria bacterium]
MLKAVVDTQVILRGATSARPTVTAKIYEAWDAGRFTLLLPEPMLEEIEDVVSRSEVRRRLRMTAVEAAALIELLRRRSTLITPTVRIARSRDPDDDTFLECAVAGIADYVVSADADRRLPGALSRRRGSGEVSRTGGPGAQPRRRHSRGGTRRATR